MLVLTILLSLLLSNFDYFVSNMMAKLPSIGLQSIEGMTNGEVSVPQSSGSELSGYISNKSLMTISPIIYDSSLSTAVQINDLSGLVIPGGKIDDVNIATILAKNNCFGTNNADCNSGVAVTQIQNYIQKSLNVPIASGIGPNAQNYNNINS
jgi:hypothetical protein